MITTGMMMFYGGISGILVSFIFLILIFSKKTINRTQYEESDDYKEAQARITDTVPSLSAEKRGMEETQILIADTEVIIPETETITERS